MESPSRLQYNVDLQAVQVRATCGAQEHRLWDRLVAAHHHLGCGSLFGKGRRQAIRIQRQICHIENRLHSVRDFTRDEDRCRVAVCHLPRNVACLTNVDISLIRCRSPFEGIPTANRYYVARSQSVLDPPPLPARLVRGAGPGTQPHCAAPTVRGVSTVPPAARAVADPPPEPRLRPAPDRKSGSSSPVRTHPGPINVPVTGGLASPPERIPEALPEVPLGAYIGAFMQ